MADLKTKQRVKVVEDLVGGYVGELRNLAAGKPPVSLSGPALPPDLDDLLAPPSDEEASQEAATPADRSLARELLAAYPKTLQAGVPVPTAAMLAIKRVTRRHAGVSSFPVLRLHVVVEGPSPAPDDDWTLELKETAGRPAALQVAIQRQFQEAPDLDPRLGWAASGQRQFRIRTVSPTQRRLDAERIAKQVKSPRWGKRDLKDLAANLGRLLARGHARALGRDGKPGLAALGGVVGAEEELRRETVAHAEKHALQNEADLRLFRELLARRGPLLGWAPP
jgi:hypothetical protein